MAISANRTPYSPHLAFVDAAERRKQSADDYNYVSYIVINKALPLYPISTLQN